MEDTSNLYELQVKFANSPNTFWLVMADDEQDALSTFLEIHDLKKTHIGIEIKRLDKYKGMYMNAAYTKAIADSLKIKDAF